MSTIGVDFVNTKYTTPSGKQIPVNIWDTAGQERFHSLIPSLYRGAQGVIITFDLTSKKSFEGVKKWMESLYQ